MSAAAPAPTKMITAEEYSRLAPTDRPSELVRGRIVVMNPPKTAHGYWCGQIYHFLDEFVRANSLGRLTTNDGGIITERDPDTVRGADVAFYSFSRVPPGKVPDTYWPAPELVCEVKSPDDRWPNIHAKIGEYLEAGVQVIWLVLPVEQKVRVYSVEKPEEVFCIGNTLTCPEVLPGFELPIAKIFE